MRLYAWGTGEGCGDELVEPRWLAWAPDAQAAALAYPDALVLCRTQPAFAAFASLPLAVRAAALVLGLRVPRRLQASRKDDAQGLTRAARRRGRPRACGTRASCGWPRRPRCTACLWPRTPRPPSPLCRRGLS
jgi:hypothetical protein